MCNASLLKAKLQKREFWKMSFAVFFFFLFPSLKPPPSRALSSIVRHGPPWPHGRFLSMLFSLLPYRPPPHTPLPSHALSFPIATTAELFSVIVCATFILSFPVQVDAMISLKFIASTLGILVAVRVVMWCIGLCLMNCPNAVFFLAGDSR